MSVGLIAFALLIPLALAASALLTVAACSSDGSESGLEFTARRRMGEAGLTPDLDQPTVLVAGVRRRIDIAWVVYSSQ